MAFESTNPSIIGLANKSWEMNGLQAAGQLMNGLAQHTTVLYVNPQPTYADLIKATIGITNEVDITRTYSAKSHLEKIGLSETASIYVLHPRPALPVNWLGSSHPFNWTRQINARRLMDDVCAAMRTLKIDQPLLINMGQPEAGLNTGKVLGEQLSIYYLDGNEAAAPAGSMAEKAENMFIAQADALITNEEHVLTTKKGIARHAFLLPDGVNFDFFNQAVGLRSIRQTIQLSWAARSKTATRRVAGYIGTVDDRIDLDLLLYSINHMPNTDFWFIGEIKSKRVDEALSKLSNVWLAGDHPSTVLPEMMAHMDVAIIPFHRNVQPSQTALVNEYLAAGMPVVATTFGNMVDHIDQIRLAVDEHMFFEQLDEALYEPYFSIDQGIDLARQHTWNKRADQFMSIINKLTSYHSFAGLSRLTSLAV
ncbi:glycosyltransferase [Arsenicibacter rosenii]|uniref:Glycosyl transferase family 1 domain-containing protein n=1 Tax=Arsenicibacter rosenii TaxID=1750698 RepID=A0A1S2VKM7_9BACT|nr:glycosyltransferase [Arsenicibacter rosenii]OIN59283.1 hypothetical protein BLX24_09860 [Arsenicibacter rosenii]